MSSIDGLRSRGEKNTTYSKRVEMRRAAAVRNINVKTRPSKTIPIKSSSSRTIPVSTTQPKRRQVQTQTKPQPSATSRKSIDMINTKQQRESFVKPVKNFDFSFDSSDISKDDVKMAKKQQKTQKNKDKKKHKKLKITLIIIFSILAILLAVALIWGNDLIARITGGNSGIFDVVNLVSENYVDLKTDSKGRTNILVFGTSGYNMDGDEGDGTHDGAQLTDSIMMVSLDQITGDVAMVSLPRDLKAGSTCTTTGKINEVYWCANQDGTNESAGAQALMTAVGNIFGVEFQYYVHADWAALTTIVDAIGGITVTLDEDIEDYYYTGTVIPANTPTTLNGEQALGLARARHGTTLGDFSRGNSQQKILIAIKDKLLSQGIDFSSATNLINAIGDNVRTNLTLDEVKTCVHLLNSVDLSEMRQVPILDWTNGITLMTTATINGISYVIPSAGAGNYTEVQTYIAKMFDSNPVVREDSTVEVLNGTGEDGVASAEKEKLTAEGFAVAATGNAPTSDYQGYSIYMINTVQTGTKKKLEDFYGVEVKSASELPAGISSSCDFIIIVGS